MDMAQNSIDAYDKIDLETILQRLSNLISTAVKAEVNKAFDER